VPENKDGMRIFGPHRDKQKETKKYIMRIFCTIHKIFLGRSNQRIRLAEHAAHERKKQCGRLGVYRRVILKWILKE
jgi:hypothetical protein